jgi:hypothetical protein
LSLRYIKGFRDRGLVNTLEYVNYSDDGGHASQKYLQGIFDPKPEEALIVETAVPEHCSYWSFQLTDMLWSSLDAMHRQSSLKGYTARLDSDGQFRPVISLKDPGVPNWLDTADSREGTIMGRWKDCSSYPQPKVSKVDFSEVRMYLPLDTPVVTKAQRDESIRLGRKGAQLRRRW